MDSLRFWLFALGGGLAVVEVWRAPATNFGLFLVALGSCVAFWK